MPALPPCFDPINTGWFDAVQGQVNAVTTPQALQDVVDQAYNSVALLNSTLTGQIANVSVIAGLLTPPVSLPGVIAWITSAIEVFTQMYAPYAKMETQLTDIAAQMATITALVESVAASKFPTATITIPPLDPFCEI